MNGMGMLFSQDRPNGWVMLRPIGIEPSWPYDKSDVMIIVDCIDHETKKPMRFVGLLEPNRRPGDARQETTQMPTNANVVSAASERMRAANDCNIKRDQKTQKKPKRGIEFSGELANAIQALQQGSDPNVKMPFIEEHLDLSHSTVYRELKRGVFPPPIRRGKSVSWLFSQIEAYRLGKWRPA